MKKLKCGVIGLGFFGEHHVNALKSIPYAEVTAVCTRRESRLKEVADKYDIPKTYRDYNELLKDKDIDMVSIVTQIEAHYPITVEALNSNKHVFLEKPMAGNLDECKKIVDTVKKSSNLFMVGHICRFDPVYALSKEEIDAGSLGKIISIHAKRNLNKNYTVMPLKHVSALFGDGIHDLDLMLWFTGSKIKSVYAQTLNSRPEFPFDDVGWAMFNFDSGCIGVIENIWCLPENTPHAIDAKMEIIGEKGAIYIDNSGLNYTVISNNRIKFPQTTYWPVIHGEEGGFLKDELEYFLKCILNNRTPEVIKPEESMYAVYAIRTAEESAKSKKIMNL